MKRSKPAAESTNPAVGAAVRTRPPGPGRALVRAIRIVASLGLFCALLQAALAGLFVTGDVGMLDMHAMNAGLVILLALVQVINTIVLWRRDRTLRWPVAVTGTLLVLAATQQVLGDARVIALHILLGTAIVAADAALVCWAVTLRPASPAAASAGGQR